MIHRKIGLDLGCTKKRILCWILISCMAFWGQAISFAAAADSVEIAAAQATDRSQIVKLCKEFVDFAGVNLIGGVGFEQMSSGQSKVFNFNRNNARLQVINSYGEGESLTQEQSQRISQCIFGKNTSNIQEGQKGGQWGTMWPLFKKIKISRLGTGYYRAKGNVVWYNDNDDTIQKDGEFKLIIKEKSGSYYGYVAKMFIIQKK